MSDQDRLNYIMKDFNRIGPTIPELLQHIEVLERNQAEMVAETRRLQDRIEATEQFLRAVEQFTLRGE